MFGMLSGLHLPEYGFNDCFASGIVDPSGLCTEFACHPFTTGSVFRDRSSRRVRYPFVTPDPPCCYQSIDPGVGDLLEVVLGAVPGISENHLRGRFDTGIFETVYGGRNHGDELLNVACLLSDIGRDDYLRV